MTSIVKPSERFKKNMIILLDIITDMFEEGSENKVVDSDTKMITILKVIISSTKGEYMIKNFIRKTNKYWDRIRNKDIEYFKNFGLELFMSTKDGGLEKIKEETSGDNSNFMKNLSEKHIENFKTLLGGSYECEGESVDIFDEERKEDIWKILFSFVRISISHIHEERKYLNGKATQEYFPEIKIKENCEKWDIKSIRF